MVSEALEEGMITLGTIEAGSSATILPPQQLFCTGDVKRLAHLLSETPRRTDYKRDIGVWSASSGADALLAEISRLIHA